MYKNISLLISVLLLLGQPVNGSPADKALAEIDDILIDPDAIAYATSNGGRQHVISNKRGIFTTHNRTANVGKPYYTAQQWRLSQSTDGGKTFTTVYESMTSVTPSLTTTFTSPAAVF